MTDNFEDFKQYYNDKSMSELQDVAANIDREKHPDKYAHVLSRIRTLTLRERAKENALKKEEEAVVTELPLVLRMSRKLIALLLLMTTGIALLTGWYGLSESNPWCIAGCGLSIVATIFVIQLFWNPPTLSLTTEGFCLSSSWRPSSRPVPWTDIEYFGYLQVQKTSMITYQVTKNSGRKRPPGGYTLPAFFGMPVQKLAMILEATRLAVVEKT